MAPRPGLELGTHELTVGLITQATSYEVPFETQRADTIGLAIISLDSAGWAASLVIMHPNEFRLEYNCNL